MRWDGVPQRREIRNRVKGRSEVGQLALVLLLLISRQCRNSDGRGILSERFK